MFDGIERHSLKDSIVSLNVITYLILFIIPFSPTWWLWPYPLLLAIEPWTPLSNNPIYLFILLPIWLFGLGTAFLVAKRFSNRNRLRNRPWLAYWWTPLIWLGILLLTEAVIFLFVRIGLGIAVGE
jgi:hypothetical protein